MLIYQRCASSDEGADCADMFLSETPSMCVCVCVYVCFVCVPACVIAFPSSISPACLGARPPVRGAPFKRQHPVICPTASRQTFVYSHRCGYPPSAAAPDVLRPGFRAGARVDAPIQSCATRELSPSLRIHQGLDNYRTLAVRCLCSFASI